jgi:hypothetical protein
MRKQIITAAIFDDESVPFGIVEPLDLASWHDELPCSFAVFLLVGVCLSAVAPAVRILFAGSVTEALHGFTLFYNATLLSANHCTESIVSVPGMCG